MAMGGVAAGRDVVAEVKARVDIVDLVGEYLSLRKVGRDFSGLCPFHEEKTPSFHVSSEKQVFYCFGCHAGGDVIHFLELKEGLGFREALEQLASRAGIALPERSPSDGHRRGRREALLGALASAAAFFHTQLAGEGGREVREYLAGRGVHEEAIRRFGLGYAPDSWDALVRALSGRGHGTDVLVAAGLARRRPSGGAFDAFRHRLMFPVCDERGRVIAFGGRRLEGGTTVSAERDGAGPKYMNSPETDVFKKRETWYGLNLAREAIRAKGRALIVEGYMDCLAAHQHGFAEAVASLGTSLTEEQARHLARFTTDVFIVYDADAAGRAGTLRGFEVLRAAGLRVRLVLLPAGRDPDELLRVEGPEAFGSYVEAALPLVEYLFQTATRDLDLGSVEGKSEAVSRLSPALAGEADPVRRDYYVQRYAQWLGVDADAVRSAVNEWQAQARLAPSAGHKSSLYRNNRSDLTPERGNTVVERRISPEERKVRKAQDMVLAFLLRGGQVEAGAIWSVAAPEWFEAGPRRELAGALRSLGANGSGAWPDGLSDEAQALAAGLLVGPEAAAAAVGGNSTDSTRILQDCLTTMAKHRVRARYQEIQRTIQAHQDSNRPVPRELLREQAGLLRELKVGGGAAWGVRS